MDFIRGNIKNLFYQSIAQILPRVILFVFYFYLAGIIGKNGFGKFDFALGIGYLAGVFYELGGNIMLTKYVARGYLSSYSYALKFRIGCILITFLVLAALLTLFGLYEDNKLNILIAAAGTAFSSLMNLNFAFFRGTRVMKYEAQILVGQKLIFISLCLALIFSLGNEPEYPAFAFALSMFISWILIDRIYRKRKDSFTNKGKFDVGFKGYVKDVLALALAEIFAIVYFRTTQIFLEQFRGYDEVGLYGISYKIIEALNIIPGILLIVLFPGFAKTAKEDFHEFKKLFKKVFIFLFTAGIAAACICIFFSGYIFKLLGKDYTGASEITAWLSFPLLAIYPNYLITQSLVALDKTKIYVYLFLSAFLLNLVLSYFLIPSLGAKGSALSVGLCEWMIFIAGYIFLLREFGKKNG